MFDSFAPLIARSLLWIPALGLAIGSLGLNAGCSASRASVLSQSSEQLLRPTAQGDFFKRLTLGDAAWAKRLDEAQVRVAIKHYSEAVKLPSPRLSAEQRRVRLAQLWTRLSRAHHLLADGHLWHHAESDTRSSLMLAQYLEGVAAAERALVLSAPTFSARVTENPRGWSQALEQIPDEALPALYWREVNLWKWAQSSGVQTILSHESDIRAALKVLRQRAPTFHEGGPDRLDALIHTASPARAGDPVRSLAAFDRSIDLSPNFFQTRVLMAHHLATLQNEQRMFEKQLNLVVSTPSNILPEYEPENTLEQRKAKALLTQTTTLFYQVPH